MGGDSKLSHFFLFLDKILVLIFFCVSAIAGGSRPALSVFRARFALVAVGNASPSSSDEPISADLRM